MNKELQELREVAEKDLFVFSKGVLGFDWLNERIHIPLCELLENYKINRRLKLTMPRGWLKTTLASQSYPLWRAVKDPNLRFLLTQNTVTNAVAKNTVIKAHIDGNKILRQLWPEVLPTKSCTWRGDSLCLNRSKNWPESTFEAAGARTQVTSRHFDAIIEDDTVAPALSDLGENCLFPSPEDIDKAIGWHQLVPPLLVDLKESQNLVVGTRWFMRDLLSWIGDNEASFVSYTRACAEDESGNPLDYRLGGTITYPERFDKDILEELRASMGPYLFNCLYLNQPAHPEDMLFRQEWFQFYESCPEGLVCYTTVDPGGDPENTKGSPDPTVVITCGKSLITGIVYVIEVTTRQMNPGETLDEIFRHVRIYHPLCVGIEANAYQHTLKYWSKERSRQQDLWFTIKLLHHNKLSKPQRIQGLQAPVAAGRLRFRRHMMKLIGQLLSVRPGGTNVSGGHDDMADALAMQLELWVQTPSQDERTDRPVDPWSLEAAIEELHDRHKHAGGLVADILQPKTGRLPGPPRTLVAQGAHNLAAKVSRSRVHSFAS